jgi:pimeloyl-ACP methyl ester carboxylesterase
MTDGHQRSEITVRRPADRALEVLAIGPADGLPLVFHHGTPGGIAVYAPMVDAAAERGLRTVLYGRPGYGASTAQPGRIVADAAGDVAAILADLGASRFVTVGWSGGGPHALACARLLANQCLAAATLAGVAPYPAEGLDWLAGMEESGVDEFVASQAGEQELSALLDKVVPLLRDLTGEVLVEGIGELAAPSDMDALRGGVADYVADQFRSGLRSGIAGWRDDDLAFARDWGFSFGRPADTAPVAVWQGDADRMVPYGHGQWLARHIPAASVHFSPGAGHMHLPFADVLDDLLTLANAR